MRKIYPAKDPNETLQYAFNWSPRRLDTATISTIEATVISGTVVVEASEVVPVDHAREGQGTKHRISGGAAGEVAQILLRAVTSNNEILEQTVYLPIRQR